MVNELPSFKKKFHRKVNKFLSDLRVVQHNTGPVNRLFDDKILGLVNDVPYAFLEDVESSPKPVSVKSSLAGRKRFNYFRRGDKRYDDLVALFSSINARHYDKSTVIDWVKRELPASISNMSGIDDLIDEAMEEGARHTKEGLSASQQLQVNLGFPIVNSFGNLMLFLIIRRLNEERSTKGIAKFLFFAGLSTQAKLLIEELINVSSGPDYAMIVSMALNIGLLFLAIRHTKSSREELARLAREFKRAEIPFKRRELRKVRDLGEKNFDRNAYLSIVLSFFGKSLNDLPRSKESVDKKDFFKKRLTGSYVPKDKFLSFVQGLVFNDGSGGRFFDFRLNREIKKLIKIAERIEDLIGVWYDEAPELFNELVITLCNRYLGINNNEQNFLLKELEGLSKDSREFKGLYQVYLDVLCISIAYFDIAFGERDMPFRGKAVNISKFIKDSLVELNELINEGNEVVKSIWDLSAKHSGGSLNPLPQLSEVNLFDYYNIISLLCLDDEHLSERFNASLTGDLLRERVYLSNLERGYESRVKAFKSVFNNLSFLCDRFTDDVGELNDLSIDDVERFIRSSPITDESIELVGDLAEHFPALSKVIPIMKDELSKRKKKKIRTDDPYLAVYDVVSSLVSH